MTITDTDLGAMEEHARGKSSHWARQTLDLIEALREDRAKVAELEAENKRLREAHTQHKRALEYFYRNAKAMGDRVRELEAAMAGYRKPTVDYPLAKLSYKDIFDDGYECAQNAAHAEGYSCGVDESRERIAELEAEVRRLRKCIDKAGDVLWSRGVD